MGTDYYFQVLNPYKYVWLVDFQHVKYVLHLLHLPYSKSLDSTVYL